MTVSKIHFKGPCSKSRKWLGNGNFCCGNRNDVIYSTFYNSNGGRAGTCNSVILNFR